jgi:predicted DNA-binding protein YlxM (UPF0122 family)
MFEKNLNISLLLDFYGDILSERQKEILDFYYNDDLSLAEIAENYDISRQGVRSVLKKGETILVEMEEKLHLAERFSSVQEKSSQIALELQEITSSIENKEISSKIQDLTSQIKDLAY